MSRVDLDDGAELAIGGQAAPTRIRTLVLAVGASLAVLAYLSRVGFASASPYLKQGLGLDDQQLGYLMAAFAFAYAVFEIPCGVLGDRLGVRHLLTFLVLGWSLMTAMVPLVVVLPMAAVVPALLVLRFGFGMFQAGGFPSLSRMMTDWMPTQERGTAQGVIWMASRSGGALAPHVIAALMLLFGGWKAPLVVVAAVGVLWCLAFWPWFRNRPEEMPRVNEAERKLIRAGRGPHPPGHAAFPWKAMLRSRSVVLLCAMYGFDGFVATFFITLLPNYLKNFRHLSDRGVTWMTSLPLACGVVGCVLGGWASDAIIRRWGNRKWGRRSCGALGMALAGLAFILTIRVQNPWSLGGLLCATFFFNDLMMGPAWASCADLGERYAGTLGGAMNMIGNLGSTAGSLVAGTLFKHGQPQLVFILFACSFWLSSLCWFGIDVTQTVRGPDATSPTRPEPEM